MILLLKSSKAHSQAPTKWQKQKTLLENKNKTKQKSKKKKICFWSWAEAGGAALPEVGLLSHQNNAKDAVKQELCATITLREDILPAQEQKQQRVESMSATIKIGKVQQLGSILVWSLGWIKETQLEWTEYHKNLPKCKVY